MKDANIIVIIIFTLLIVIALGCIFMSQTDYIYDNTIDHKGAYNIKLIDNHDLRYINFFFPGFTIDAIDDEEPNNIEHLDLVKEDTIDNPDIDFAKAIKSYQDGYKVDKKNKSLGYSEPNIVNKLYEDNSNRFRIDNPLLNEFKKRRVKDPLHGIASSGKKKRDDPDDKLRDNELLESSENNYGNDLPWDNDVTYCTILKENEQDLYQTVRDTHIITFY